MAGEQFANYPARVLISRYMHGGEGSEHELDWAAPLPTLAQQAAWYRDLCREAPWLPRPSWTGWRGST